MLILFNKILDESARKPNKVWVDKGSKCYNRSVKSWLQISDKEKHSMHNEGKTVVAERYNRTLKNKIYKYMTSVSKNVHIDKLVVINNKYNNTYQSIVKMKCLDVTSSTYVNFNKENNKKAPKFEVDDHARNLKNKNTFAKGYVSNWFEEDFVIQEVKNTVPWTSFTSDINGEEIVRTFYKKELQKYNSKKVHS